MAEKLCAITVAIAAPATPHPKPATKRISNEIFSTDAMIIAVNGVLLFPIALKAAANIL